MTNDEFLDRAWKETGPKVLSGFSRPLYHNVMGLLHGYKFDKKRYGGMIRHSEAGMLTKWASQIPKNGTVVEIGCYGGLSTSYLLTGLQKQGGKIYAIDPFNSDLDKQESLSDNCVPLEQKPTESLVAERLTQNGFEGMFELIEGFSQDAAKNWDPTIKIDFLWIDGNHEQAYKDFKDFERHLAPGARVAVHDAHPRYGYEAVVRDVRKIFSEGTWESMEHVKSIITGKRAQ